MDRGWSILIYPEGTRSTTDQMGPFKAGMGLLGVELQVPVVPIRLAGTYRVLPKGRSIPRPGQIEVIIGQPITFAPETPYTVVTQAVEAAVRALGEGR